jgi:hypothetical protein
MWPPLQDNGRTPVTFGPSSARAGYPAGDVV